MGKWIQFDMGAEKKVFVMTSNVTHVIPLGDAESVIHFVGGGQVEVKGKYQTVTSRLLN